MQRINEFILKISYIFLHPKEPCYSPFIRHHEKVSLWGIGSGKTCFLQAFGMRRMVLLKAELVGVRHKYRRSSNGKGVAGDVKPSGLFGNMSCGYYILGKTTFGRFFTPKSIIIRQAARSLHTKLTRKLKSTQPENSHA